MAEEGYRQESKVSPGDADFSIRKATVEELVRVNDEDRIRGWSARWSTTETLRNEVAPGSTAILCPLFRNGGPIEGPESYRCHVFFASAKENRGKVALVDVGKGTLESLAEIDSIEKMARAVRLLVDSYDLTPLG